MLLASLDDLKLFLDITVATHDTLLTRILTQVSKRTETFLNRSIEKAARTVYYNAGRKYYYLPAPPIDTTAVLTVVYNANTLVVNTDYFVWYEEGGIEFSPVLTYLKPKDLVITYTGGYVNLTDLPADIQMAVVMQSAFVFRRRKDIGLNSISLPDGSISVNAPTELLPEVKSVLKSYRRSPTVR